ncbi:MAG: YXWGXW repeat-containing protein [Acidobacteria bacterium]|jgi:hypothetical protein|nr:YXWGXW repeat-containing protein [Acidobacteriota bacterium]
MTICQRLMSLGVLGAALLLSACSSGPRGPVVYVRTPPPPPLGERHMMAPGPDFIWIGGYQRWTGAGYRWVPGHWERRPDRHRRWVAGHWAHNRHGWYWVEGYWR